MPHTAVASDFGQALDVKCCLAAQVAFHDVTVINAFTQFVFFFFGQIFYSGIGIDPCLFEDLGCAGSANTVDIGETDLNSLVLGQVNAGYTCHIFLSSFR